MSSLSLANEAEARPRTAALLRFLDMAFGFFVGAGHLLAVYIPTAVACQLGLGTAGAGTRTAFLTSLTILTVVTAAVVLLHAFLRYRRLQGAPDQLFRMTVTVGCDAIATVAILLQLFPVLLTPLCA